MIGRTVSHYKILEELGGGGMGVVYKAHDTELDRTVALKFLPQRLAATDEDKQRFTREAKAAAALNHPNICTIYSVDEHEGRQFISMEYVDGATLRDRLGHPAFSPTTKGDVRGGLSTNEMISFAIQIAEAIEEAHSEGIVHRDIKPENIMVDSKNRIKVMDFGLAKLKGSANLTKEGSTVGTVAYMSPEQIQGQYVDHRSDIFSFGVVLYEMLAGHTPFRGEHDAAMLYSIVNEEPHPISSYVPDISSPIQNLIERTLEKDPADRYQSMEDLLSDLRRLKRKTSKKVATHIGSTPSAPPAGEQQQSLYTQPKLLARSTVVYIMSALVIAIAVLASYLMFFRPDIADTHSLNPNRVFVAAFENRTGDPSLDPIGRLMSDWVTQGIMNNELAEVIPTTVMLQMIQEAGPVGGGLADRTNLIELAVATNSRILISGMFYTVGEDIQFEAQIIDAQENDVMMTLERVRGPRGEPMKAINELQQKIMGALAMHAFPGADISFVGEPPIYEAYVEYLEGTRIFGVDYERAFDHYRSAIEIDPQFIGPKLRMATGYANMGQWAEADSIFQTIDRQTRRLSAYERYYLDWFAFHLQGRHEEALAVLLHIESIAPVDYVTNYLVGLYALNLNRPRKTVETFAKLDFQIRWADFAATSWRFGVLSDAYHLLGNHQKELEVAREGQTYFPSDLGLRADEICALAGLGNVEELYDVVEESKRIEQPLGSVGAVMLVASLELRAHGNRTEALRIAEQAIQWYEEHDPGNKAARANALYYAERWDESFALYRELAAEDPEDVFLKSTLGVLAARRGDREEARRISRELEKTDQKYLFGRHTYNRACIHALLGEPAVAVKLLEESLEQGRRFGIHIHRDIDLEALHDYPPFQELLKPKR
jgi:serine/threonine protein kinase/tetratricopeptide (TPR) repeat protein